MKYFLSLVLFCLLFQHCGKEDSFAGTAYSYDWYSHIPFKTNYQLLWTQFSGSYQSLPVEMGEVNLTEVSGIAWSRNNPGMLWAHNDSGHSNSLFLLHGESGEIVTKYTIHGTANIDWEDMEVAVGPEAGASYIYIADTGDNSQKRKEYTVYRFKEPVHSNEHTDSGNIFISDAEVEKIRFRYPDGSHDTEAMFVDPVTKDIYLATKRDVVSFLYVIPYPQKTEEVYTIFKAGEFSFREASAGTVSADGDKILIKNRQNIYYWERAEGEKLFETLERAPLRAPYIGEPQGEAICFDNHNNYLTLSEQTNSLIKPILYKYFKL